MGRIPRWVFPAGTLFGEVLLVSDGRYEYPFEMRTREKVVAQWVVDVFRPYPTAEDLIDALPDGHPIQTHLQSSGLTPLIVKSDYPNTVAIFARASVDVLPPFTDPQLVRKLLDVEFRSAFGQSWRGDCYAPTTKSGFSVVPVNYQGTFVGTDNESCAKCHESSQLDISKFEIPRDWYGHIRGSDRILSFSIADPRLIGRYGSDWRVRPALAPVVEQYDPARHADYVDTTADR